MSDRIDELVAICTKQMNACNGCPNLLAITELATIARERDLWRRRAVTLAAVIGDFTEPLHFATVDGVRTATVRALASVMFSLDDGTLFRHPENALDAARKVVTRGE